MSITKVSEEKLKALGVYIKKIREKRQLGTNQLAAKIDLSPSYITKLEKGHIATVHPYLLKSVAEGLRIDYKELYKIVDYLDSIEAKEDRSNVIRITTKKVPLYGTASAGPGYINLSEEIEEFPIPIEDYKPGRFVVRVKGDSMTGPVKSIPDGTVALVDPSMCEAESLVNKVCVFTYNGETYIKQLVINNQNIVQLVSFNPEMETIIVLQPKELKCEGRVVKTWSEQSW